MTFKELLYLTIKNIYFYRVQLSKALLLPFILSVLLDIFALRSWSLLTVPRNGKDDDGESIS